MIMQRQSDGTYAQIGFIKTPTEDIDRIVDRNGDLYFEKGFTRQITGAPPLSLDAIGKPLINYKIYGNTVQDGTPSPENPVEVQSVGDKTRNLFDYMTMAGNTVGWLDEAGNVHHEDIWKITEFIPCYGKIFTLNKIGGDSPSICLYDENKNIIVGKRYASSVQHKVAVTIKSETMAYYIRFSYCIRPDIVDNLEKIQLELGSEPTPYVPYGYEIPVVCRGKNLVDLKDLTGMTSSLFDNTINPKLAEIQFKENAQYTITIKYSIDTTAGWRKITFTYSDGTTSSSSWLSRSNNFSFTSKIGKTVTSVAFTNYNVYLDIYVEYIQLEISTEATEYEPYHEPVTTSIFLDKPLYKGDYITKDDSGGKVHRAWREVVFTGNESWKDTVNPDADGMFVLNAYYGDTFFILSFCSHLEYINNYPLKKAGYFYDYRLKQIFMNIGIGVTLTDFKSFLASEYAKGTPVTIYYPLAEPTEEPIELPEIPTFDDTTIIEIDTEIQPSDIEITYKSRR